MKLCRNVLSVYDIMWFKFQRFLSTFNNEWKLPAEGSWMTPQISAQNHAPTIILGSMIDPNVDTNLPKNDISGMRHKGDIAIPAPTTLTQKRQMFGLMVLH